MRIQHFSPVRLDPSAASLGSAGTMRYFYDYMISDLNQPLPLTSKQASRVSVSTVPRHSTRSTWPWLVLSTMQLRLQRATDIRDRAMCEGKVFMAGGDLAGFHADLSWRQKRPEP